MNHRTPLPPPPKIAGYLWSGDPAGGYYTYDSLRGIISVSSNHTGFYAIFFGAPGPVPGGTIDITPYGKAGTCAGGRYSPQGDNWRTTVDCSSLSGAAQISYFDLAFAEPTSQPSGVFDFALVRPAGPKLTGPDQFNSSHRANSVRHLGRGRYQITVPGPAVRGVTGTVKVTAIGGAAGDCEVAGWHGTAKGRLVDVDCFSATGARSDSAFTVTYLRHNNLLGLSDLTSAYAFANRPGQTGSYRPSPQYSSQHGARVSVDRLARGQYQVSFIGSAGPVALNGGHVQVSAVGSSDHHCYVALWTSSPNAYIDCVSNSGAFSDTAFTIHWVVG